MTTAATTVRSTTRGNYRIRMETEAKLFIQRLMRTGAVEYAWSDMLSREVLDNPYRTRREKILEWIVDATVIVAITPEILSVAANLVAQGLGNADALHVACAAAADCDWFFTTDVRLLKKVRNVGIT